MLPRVVKTDGGRLVLSDEERAALDALASFDEVDGGSEDALIERAADAAALLVVKEPITARVLDHLTQCRVVTRFGVGLDTVDLAAATARGVRVTNVPDANFKEVAAHALAMILALLRRIPQFDAATRRGDWNLGVGGEMHRLDGLVLGLIGVGRIGSAVATPARALGFTVLGFDPHLDDATVRARGAEPASLERLLESSDVVSLHIPLTAETRMLLDRERLAHMRPGAVLVNVSRGGLVDEEALVDALADGTLGAAGLDAYEREPLPLASRLLSAPNLLLTPHSAHYSLESRREIVGKAIADVLRVLRGDEPRYPVN